MCCVRAEDECCVVCEVHDGVVSGGVCVLVSCECPGSTHSAEDGRSFGRIQSARGVRTTEGVVDWGQFGSRFGSAALEALSHVLTGNLLRHAKVFWGGCGGCGCGAVRGLVPG